VQSLEEIIKACKSGKRNAQEELYKMFSRKMYGVCLRYSKDSTAAEDVLQDGFIKVFQNIKQFEGKGSFEGWVRKIMVNSALERYRKQHFMYANNDVEHYSEDFSYDDIISQVSAQDLLKLIQELSPQYRMVFCLFAIDGYSHDEIAQMLNISEGTSKSNLSRARKILQQQVKEMYGHTYRKSWLAI